MRIYIRNQSSPSAGTVAAVFGDRDGGNTDAAESEFQGADYVCEEIDRESESDRAAIEKQAEHFDPWLRKVARAVVEELERRD